MRNKDNDTTKETEVKDLSDTPDSQLNEEELDEASGGIAPICKNSGVGCTQSFTIQRKAFENLRVTV